MDEEQRKALMAEAAKDLEERRKKAEAEAKEKLRKVLDTPLGQEEGQKQLAEIEVQKAQLCAYRNSLRAQRLQIDMSINGAEAELARLACDAAVLKRQVLNKAG